MPRYDVAITAHCCRPGPKLSIGTFVHHRGRVSLGPALVPPPLLAGFRLVTAHRAASMPHRSAGASRRAETVGRSEKRRRTLNGAARSLRVACQADRRPDIHEPRGEELAPRRDQAERTRCSSEATRQRPAPVSIAITPVSLRTEPLPEPPPARDSAAKPVSVVVSTVVVRSGTAMDRTTALRTTMAEAMRTMSAYAERHCPDGPLWRPPRPRRWRAGTSRSPERAPRARDAGSPSVSPARRQRRLRSGRHPETIGATTGSPPLPVIPKPDRTTLPVSSP
jgi:hypothetical protein